MGCKVYHDEGRHNWSRRITKLTSFRAQGDRLWVRILQGRRIVLCRFIEAFDITRPNLEGTPAALLSRFSLPSKSRPSSLVCMHFSSRSQNLEVIS